MFNSFPQLFLLFGNSHLCKLCDFCFLVFLFNNFEQLKVIKVLRNIRRTLCSPLFVNLPPHCLSDWRAPVVHWSIPDMTAVKREEMRGAETHEERRSNSFLVIFSVAFTVLSRHDSFKGRSALSSDVIYRSNLSHFINLHHYFGLVVPLTSLLLFSSFHSFLSFLKKIIFNTL